MTSDSYFVYFEYSIKNWPLGKESYHIGPGSLLFSKVSLEWETPAGMHGNREAYNVICELWPCCSAICTPDSNKGRPNFVQTAERQYRRWPNFEPTPLTA